MLLSLSLLVDVAADLRQRAKQTEPAFSTRAIIEVCFPSVLVTGRDLPDGIEEAVTVSRGSPIIIYRRDLATARKRFVIAHALAHIIFDGAETVCRPGFVGHPKIEQRADSFAEELLVPLAELRPYVCRWPSDDPADQEIYLDMIDEIASHFHVPSSVIDKRIREHIPPE